MDFGPDLVITELRAPDSVRPGETFTATAKVCNQGSEAAYPQGSGAILQVYLSTTPTQQVPAPNAPPMTQQITVGEVDVGPLEAQQCVTRTVNAYALPPPGQPGTAFYLGASVDTWQSVAELDETNNGFVRGLMGVGMGPDLTVTEVKTPASVEPGGPFLADVRVCNVGTEDSPFSNVELYLSTQDTLSFPTPGSPSESQVSVGIVPVPQLEAGRCITVRTRAFAYPPVGTQPEQPLYVGAIVDPSQQNLELREDNNTFVQGLVGVGNGPDLVVTDLTGPANVAVGYPFSGSVTVCNVGTRPAVDVRADVLLSTEASLSASHQPGSQTESFVAEAQAPGLDAGRCVTLPVSGSPYPPPAFQPGEPLYLGARVDGTQSVPELREDNNTFVKSVGEGYGPDLVVRSVKGPTNLPDSYSFRIEAQVCNVGTHDLYGSAFLELFLSTEPELTLPPSSGSYPMRTQAPLGGASVSYLVAGQCQTVTVEAYRHLPMEAQPGQPLYLGAAIDTLRFVQELNEDNNTFIQGLVGTGSEADLVITDVRAPANLTDGQTFTATYTVCNRGNTLAHDYGVSLFLSTETQPLVSRPPPAPPAYMEVPRAYAFLGRAQPYASLAAGQCTTESSMFHAMRPPDTTLSSVERPLNLSAVVDLPQPEPRTDNNGFSAGIVGLGFGPDLVITELQGPASVRPWDSFTSTVKVCNVGTVGMNTGAYVDVYVSVDDTLPALDPLAPPGPLPMGNQMFVGGTTLPSLGAGACATRQIVGPARLPSHAVPFRPLYLGAITAQALQAQELRWDNNTRVTGPLSVGNGPDLVVTSVEAPDTVAPWEPFAATVRVCNVGTDSVSPTEVAVVVSAEETWTLPPQGTPMPFPNSTQYMAGILNVAPLQAGQCVSSLGMMSVTQPPGTSPGQPLYLSAAVDPFQGRMELREDNNVFVKGRLGVGWEADLVITALTPPASIRPGESFTATLTVCNQGSSPSVGGPQVTLQLLTLPELSLPPQGAPPVPQDAFLGEFFLPQLAAHTCTTTPVTGNFYGYLWSQQRTYYVGATVDRNWSTPEVRKDNNTFVGPRVGVGNAPDLVITAVGGPANIEPSGQVQVPVTVCNQGTQPSSSMQTVELYISTESTPPAPPFPGRPMDPSSGVFLVGTVDIPPLPENACVTREGTLHSSPVSSGPETPLFLSAVLNGWNSSDELRTDNNAFVRGRIGVGYAPDLVVTEVTAPFAVRVGEMFTTTVTVCNQGTQPSWGNSRAEIHLSTQPTLAFPDEMPSASTQTLLGEVDVGELAAGACTSRNLFTSAYMLPGNQNSGLFYLGALVDPQRSVTELREDNNTFVESFLAVLP